MDPNTTSAIRDIFVMVAAGGFSVLCMVLVFLIARLYGPLRDSIHHVSDTARNLSVITTNVAAVSEETAANIAQTSRNAVTITESLKEGSDELSGVVRTAGEAAKSVSEAASNVSSISETVSRLTSVGVSGESSAGVGSLLRLARTILGGGRRRSEDSAGQRGA